MKKTKRSKKLIHNQAFQVTVFAVVGCLVIAGVMTYLFDKAAGPPPTYVPTAGEVTIVATPTNNSNVVQTTSTVHLSGISKSQNSMQNNLIMIIFACAVFLVGTFIAAKLGWIKKFMSVLVPLPQS